MELFRNDFPNLRGRVKLLPNGPPVPYPVQFRVVRARTRARCARWADEAKELVRANPNMRGVNDNWNESSRCCAWRSTRTRRVRSASSARRIARLAQTILSGSTIGQYREGDKLIDIVLRQPLDERAITDLANAYMPTASGRAVPLSQLVKVEFGWEPGVMWRENRDYAITVQSDVVEGCRAPTVTAQMLDPQLPRCVPACRPGYRIEVAGAAEESSKGRARSPPACR
jgi:multidrug efflux pump